MKLLLLLSAFALTIGACAQTKVIAIGLDSATVKKVDSLIQATPTIVAGDLDVLITQPISVVLNAKLTGKAPVILWEIVSYSNTRPTILNPAIVNPEVSGLLVGRYVFRLNVTDQGQKISTLVTVNIR